MIDVENMYERMLSLLLSYKGIGDFPRFFFSEFFIFRIRGHIR
jgi:hypothetical protein